MYNNENSNLLDNYIVGNVLEIVGNKRKILMRQNTNMFVYFYRGKEYRGVSIGGYVGIVRGSYKIIAKVEKETLVDTQKDENDLSYSLKRFKRMIEVSVVGYFSNEVFNFGIDFLPMIYNEVVLLSKDDIEKVFYSFIKVNDNKNLLHIGQTVPDDIPMNIDYSTLFNTHIGIFGNTGSGKSNTLAKLYTTLFASEKLVNWEKNSKFFILDFNGEYIGDNLFVAKECNSKEVIKLNTGSKEDIKQNADSNDDKTKLKISPKEFWTVEVLSILFSATEKTQKPFLRNMLDFYAKNGNVTSNEICVAIKNSIKHLIEGNNNRTMLDCLKSIFSLTLQNYDKNNDSCYLNKIEWHNNSNTFVYMKKNEKVFFNNVEDKKEIINSIENEYAKEFEMGKIEEIDFTSLSITDKIIILINAQLIYGLRYNHIQFEHISPLLARINSFRDCLEKTIEIGEPEEKPITVVSFRDCDEQAKRILPLLIVKQLYDTHIKENNKTEINRTVHLIIDEAHNILSDETSREGGTFKDYRLDVFEKIIKEGRKFGFYLTVSSQRPADISQTIVSQLHNFFIHRLVNERDLRMIENTISSLDYSSRNKISMLAPGECIITGTSFNMPILVKIDKLEKEKSPNSENADLEKLWRISENESSSAEIHQMKSNERM